MKQKTYKTASIIAAIISVIGLISFVGGVRAVNIGAFVFPALIAVSPFYLYKKAE